MRSDVGLVTLPSELGKEELVLEMARKWGADAIRDSHGTKLPEAVLDLNFSIYSTICITRDDQEWIRSHKEFWVQKYFLSAPILAVSDKIEIDVMANVSREVYEIDKIHDPKKWWEVIDRTTGEVVDPRDWLFEAHTEKVIITGVNKFHKYTVAFLVYQIWDGNDMYNSRINKWNKEKDISINPYHPMARKHIMEHFEKWLKAHPQTDVVRLTTLAYCYTFDIASDERLRYWDWFGYTDCLSILALEEFEKQYGYRLRPEHIVDQGYYNATYKIPTPEYCDWMTFIHNFVMDFGKEIVQRIHKSGKKAAIFWGDQWAGVEPYSDDFKNLKLDVNVGACEDGVALRRLADLEGDYIKEIRLYPYFFPDVFKVDGEGRPTEESVRNWVKIRRALLRKGVDRIGYGGYLSLAAKYPEFLNHVEMLCKEFRTIKNHTQKTEPYTAPIRVGMLNYWGKLRSWVNELGPSEKFYSPERLDVVEITGSNLLECLSGLPVSVSFISFTDILEKRALKNLDVVINSGSADTSWSGGRDWSNPHILSAVREFVHNGGGFIGVREPSAYEYQGAYFQLYDVLGVQKEVGKTILMKYWDLNKYGKHFITQDMQEVSCPNFENTYVYPCGSSTEVLLAHARHVQLACNAFGSGRSVYIFNLPYNLINTRLLHRALFWVSRKENEIYKWFSSNLHTECAAYPGAGYFTVINNSGETQTTMIHNDKGQQMAISVDAFESKWFEIQKSFGL